MKKLFWFITVFGIFSILIMFYLLLIYQVGDEYVLTNLETVTPAIVDNMGIDPQMETHIMSLPQQYRDLNIPWDFIFLGFFIFAFLTSLLAAMQIKEEGWWSYFGGITILLMVFLLITGYIALVKDWLVTTLFVGFLEVNLATMPIFNYYVTNMGFINFLWAVILMTANKLNFSYNRIDDESTDTTMDGGYLGR